MNEPRRMKQLLIKVREVVESCKKNGITITDDCLNLVAQNAIKYLVKERMYYEGKYDQ